MLEKFHVADPGIFIPDGKIFYYYYYFYLPLPPSNFTLLGPSCDPFGMRRIIISFADKDRDFNGFF